MSKANKWKFFHLFDYGFYIDQTKVQLPGVTRYPNTFPDAASQEVTTHM